MANRIFTALTYTDRRFVQPGAAKPDYMEGKQTECTHVSMTQGLPVTVKERLRSWINRGEGRRGGKEWRGATLNLGWEGNCSGSISISLKSILGLMGSGWWEAFPKIPQTSWNQWSTSLDVHKPAFALESMSEESVNLKTADEFAAPDEDNCDGAQSRRQ